jgi:hypothetical protein
MRRTLLHDNKKDGIDSVRNLTGLLRKTSQVSLFVFSPLLAAHAQVSLDWVQRYNGPANAFDFARAVAVDDSGNAYITGISQGSGTFDDYATIKYGTDGQVSWIQRYDGPASEFDDALALAVDDNDNVYVTGFSAGAGTFNDFATVKYSSTGVEQWVARYDGPISDFDNAVAIAIDDSGHVYVTGSSPGTNFVPEFATIKYDSAGNERWVARYGSPALAGDFPYALAVDAAGNVYVTGASYDNTFTPNFATVKYNAAGVRQWVRRYDGPGAGLDEPHAIGLDAAGNIYVTGASMSASFDFDYLTIKYSPTGDSLWVRRYNGPAGTGTDTPIGLAVDGTGNIYVTGYSAGNGSGTDMLTIKYDAAGVEKWVARYNGPGDTEDFANAITVDDSGNVYVAGRSGNFTAFNYTTVAYDSNGTELWAEKYDGPSLGFDEAFAIAVDDKGHLFVTGGSDGVGTDQDYATIRYSLTQEALPDAPNLLSPENNAVIIADSVDFIWHQSQPDADTYWFELATDSLFSAAFVDSSLTDTTTTVTELQHSQTYWWRVRAHNAAGWGEFSEAWRFSVLIPEIDSALAFLPLHVGNVWQYHYFYSDACGSEHSSYHLVEVTGDTLLPTEYNYQIVVSDLPGDEPLRYLRVDTASANVYEYDWQLGECLAESLRSTAGSGWFYLNCSGPTECTAVDTEDIFGLPTIVKRFMINYIPFGEDYALGYGFGRTEHTTFSEDPCYPVIVYHFRELVYGRINGVEYGTLMNVDEWKKLRPSTFNLEQNYPNPFNPSTKIRYGLPQRTHVRLELYDLLGRRVAVLVNAEQEAGYHQVTIDRASITDSAKRGHASGVYFYRLQAGGFVETKKMLVLR